MSIYLRVIAILCCVFLTNCSVWMTNRESPVRLSGCHVWPAVVDTTLATGMGTVAVVSDKTDVFTVDEKEKQIHMIGSVLLAAGFFMAALMGYGQYYGDIKAGRCNEDTTSQRPPHGMGSPTGQAIQLSN